MDGRGFEPRAKHFFYASVIFRTMHFSDFQYSVKKKFHMTFYVICMHMSILDRITWQAFPFKRKLYLGFIRINQMHVF